MILVTGENLAAAWRWRRLWCYGRRGALVVYGAKCRAG